jgi:hypothetical protein
MGKVFGTKKIDLLGGLMLSSLLLVNLLLF